MMTLTFKYATDLVDSFNKEELSNLLKEIKIIGNADSLRKISQSDNMKMLFLIENKNSEYWSDKYHNVKRAIENEILHRVRTDNF